jgi:iron complex outermembrane receptor protein
MLLLFIALPIALAETIQLSEVHVIESPSSLYEFIPTTTTLRGEELQKKREVSLGDSLKSEAGVSSGSFGPGSGRPIIRGLEGDRIRVLQNGLGTMDASSQSVDHGVPVDMLNTDQVDIVRGPMSLLYGASAVGGVVNLSNQRIHHSFEEGALSQFDTRSESVYGGSATAARVDWGKEQWMVHLDGSWRDLGDQRIGGGDRLNNTQVEQEGVGAGLSRIMDKGHIGFSFSHFGSQYGSVAEEEVGIRMRQNRWEMDGEWRPENAWIDKIHIRSAQSRYRHDEREGDVVGTIFKNNGNESRLEFLRSRGDWHHVMGLQTQIFEFSAEGEEAYLPTADNRIGALFSFHEKRMGGMTYNFGARLEDALVEREASDTFGESSERGFTGVSGALGVLKKWGAWGLGATASYTERAPTFQELYSEGAHVATGTYESGEESLGKEKGRSLEVSLRHENEKNRSRVAAYVQDFQHYVALIPTGATDVDSGFPMYEYEAVDARFYGMEAENSYQLNSNWTVIGKGDWVRAKNRTSGDNLPRLSPARIGAGLEWTKDQWTLDGELQHAFEQHKIADGETRTTAYDLLSAGVARSFSGEKTQLTIYLRAKNLFDERARNHSSTVKEIAPMPGRNFVAGLTAIW